MKIMHGMREVAGQAYYSVKGLRSNGYDAKLILWDESPLKYPYDYNHYTFVHIYTNGFSRV